MRAVCLYPRRSTISLGIIFGMVSILLTDTASGDELLITSFFSDSVGRYDAANGDFIANFEDAGQEGTLAARIGADGLLYVASEASNEVKRYNTATGAFVDDFVVAGAGGLDGPSGVSWDTSGNLLVASFNNDSVLRFDGQTGTYIDTPITSGFGGLNGPDNGMIMGDDGLLYVPSYFTNQIIRYDLSSGSSEVFINGILRPRVLVFEGGELFITSEVSDSVRRYSLNGTFIDDFIRPGSAILDEPVGLEFFNDSWFVSSASMDKVLQFDASGTLVDADFISVASGGIDGPVFITGVRAVPEPSAAISLLFCGTLLVLRRDRIPGAESRSRGTL